MAAATLNGIPGSGEINGSTDDGVAIVLGRFRPDDLDDMTSLDTARAHHFEGMINGEHGTAKVQIMGFDRNDQSYRITPMPEFDS